jgi:hypothetical protein
MMATFKIKPKEPQYEVIQWTNNEAEIRNFIQDDGSQRYLVNNTLQVYNKPTQTWINVPMFSFIAKSNRGVLFVIAPEDMDCDYERM